MLATIHGGSTVNKRFGFISLAVAGVCWFLGMGMYFSIFLYLGLFLLAVGFFVNQEGK